MKKENLIIIAIIGGMILISLGYGLGYLTLQKQLKSPTEVSPLTLQTSKVIRNWNGTASGQVTKISDRTLTLTAEGENLEIVIKEDAKIQTLSFQAGETKEEIKKRTKELSFEDIKVGDNVNISISPKGEIVEGYIVTVLTP
jgi:hypothetical protein